MEPTEIGKLASMSSIADALKALAASKEQVTLHLAPGQTLTGTVAKVGLQLVQLGELAPGRQFYDALVQLSAIVAIEVRARGK